MSGPISAGLVNLTNLTVNGLGAGSINTTNLNFNNLSIAQNLNVAGNFSLSGFNNYEGSYKAGDIISYTLKGTMLTALANVYFSVIYPPGNNSIYKPDSSYNIDFYEMIYWGVDSRSNDTVRMSATVCVPSTIVSSTVVSHKHGTLTNTYQLYTLWQEMKNIVSGVASPPTNTPSLNAWVLATTGYVTVCADNPGYGVSLGNYNFIDPTGESYSQYNAVVALKQLIEKQPDIFNQTFPAKLNVISTGYSLGALYCPLVSELIALNPSFKLVNTIPGAPTNPYRLMDKAFFNSTNGTQVSPYRTSLSVLLFSMLLVNANNKIYGPLINIKPNINFGVLPMLEQLYLDTTRNNATNSPYGLFPRLIKFMQRASNNQAIVDFSGNPYILDFPYQGAQAFVIPSQIANVPSVNLEIAKQSTFFTNIFEDFSDLSGTPINVMYSLQDQLGCYNPANPYFGSASRDLIAGPLRTFITTDNSGNGGFNGLNRSNYTDTTVDASQNGLIGQMATAATALVNSENTNNCSNTRWNTLPLGAGLQEHGFFSYRIFQTVVRKYLLTRPY